MYRRHRAWIWPSSVSALVVFGGFVGICGLLVWLGDPVSEDGTSNLGSVLEAQAAMTAIFLAAMIFIVEAVQRREGLDDPLYELFLTKSWTRWIFATAVWLLISTALLYVFGPITGLLVELADDRGDALGIASLVVAAFFVLVFLLRALHVLRPEQYRELRQTAVLDQVRRGARSQAQASQSTKESVRRFLGLLSAPETQATRAIERVVDQMSRAAQEGQLTDVREGMALMEEIARTVLEELDESGVARPDVDGFGDRDWLGHDFILSGLQRVVRNAASSDASDFVLWAVFRTDVQKTGPGWMTPYRLADNIGSSNELFVQVMLECVEAEQLAVAKLAFTEKSKRLGTPQNEMLSDALLRALIGSGTSGGSREDRIARRVLAFNHRLASRAALDRNEKQACALLESVLGYAKDAIFSSEGEPGHGDELLRVLRQAALSAIGYAIGVGNPDFLDTAARRLTVGDVIETGQVDELYLRIDQDVSNRSEGRSILGAGLLWLSSVIHPKPSSIETEEGVHQREIECVILGYMWLLGRVYDGTGVLELPDTVSSEFERVWHLHGARLVAALRGAGVGGGQDLRGWCQTAFGDDQGDP